MAKTVRKSVHRHVRPQPAASEPRPTRWGPLLAAALIVAAVATAYSNSFTGVFVLDEQTAIIDNPNIRSLSTAFSAPKDVGFAGRPVVSLSFALNYALAPAEAREAFTPPPPGYPPEATSLFHANVWGYHAVNLAIHAGCALLLFGILRRTLSSPRLEPRFGAQALLLSLVAALAWAVHPLTTGSVTYVAQRVESLMALFYLLTVYCAIRAWEAGEGEPAAPGSGQRAWTSKAWIAASIAACALGAASKEVIVSAPLFVVLYDLILFAPDRGEPLGPAARAIVRRRWPLYLGLFASWLLLAGLVLANPRPGSVGFGVKGWSSWDYLRTQAGVIAHYLRLAFWPSPLVLDYDWPMAASLTAVWPQALVLVALVAVTAWGLLRRSPLALAGAWFFLILAPSSSLLPIPTEVAAEHRMYLPLCAVVTLVVIGGYALAQHLAGVGRGVRFAGPPAAGRLHFAVVVFALLAVPSLAAATRQRNDDYQSDERIWADTVAVRPDNARARTNYGAALFTRQQFADAERELRAAIALRPGYAEAHLNLGAVLCSEGRLEDGIESFRRAIALEPGYRDAYRNLGEALASLGRDAEAVGAFREALRSRPDDARLRDRLAWILATSALDNVRNGNQAVQLAETAVEATQGSDPNILDTLAAAYAEANRFGDAIAAQERAIALAGTRGMGGLVAEMQTRLSMYRSQQKFRERRPGA